MVLRKTKLFSNLPSMSNYWFIMHSLNFCTFDMLQEELKKKVREITYFDELRITVCKNDCIYCVTEILEKLCATPSDSNLSV